jgi:hypothetical protein
VSIMPAADAPCELPRTPYIRTSENPIHANFRESDFYELQ